jgi:hypothetical protein
MAHLPEDFIGSWHLVDWRIEYSDGGVTHPFGDRPLGFIVYAPDGIMSASISRTARPAFAVANVRNASAEDKAAAFDSYFHYAGPWRIEGEEVVHQVTMALNPAMTGTDQRRLARFDGRGGLELSADEAIKGGTSRRHILQWQRRPLHQTAP